MNFLRFGANEAFFSLRYCELHYEERCMSLHTVNCIDEKVLLWKKFWGKKLSKGPSSPTSGSCVAWKTSNLSKTQPSLSIFPRSAAFFTKVLSSSWIQEVTLQPTYQALDSYSTFTRIMGIHYASYLFIFLTLWGNRARSGTHATVRYDQRLLRMRLWFISNRFNSWKLLVLHFGAGGCCCCKHSGNLQRVLTLVLGSPGAGATNSRNLLKYIESTPQKFA